MDGFVDTFESIPERLLEVADPVQLCVMWTHHGAVLTQKLVTGVAVVPYRLPMQHATVQLGHLRVERSIHATSKTRLLVAHRLEAGCQILWHRVPAILDLTC